MRIVIDMQCLQTNSRFRGIGHYALSLVREMLVQNQQCEQPHDIFLLFNHHEPEVISQLRNDWADVLGPDSIRMFRSLPNTSALSPFNEAASAISEVLRDDFIARLQPDFVLIASLFEGGGDEPYVSHIPPRDQRDYATGVIGYDLIPLISADQYLGVTQIRRWYERKLASVERADRVLTISLSAMREFQTHLQLGEGVVHNISSACDSAYHRLPEDEISDEPLRQLGITKPFILYSGAADARKNLQGLLEAFAGLDSDLREQHQLVLVGRFKEEDQAHLARVARRLGIPSGHIIYTGFIHQQDLNLLYNRCAAFVFPSFHEGFGLPVLEAITCGAPTICSNTTSLPEVIGLDEATFDPHDVVDMTARLRQVLTDSEYRQRLINHGLEQARQFSWSATAKRVFEQIELCVKERNGHGKTNEGKTSERPDRISLLAELIHTLAVDDELIRRTANCLADNDLELERRRWPTESYHWRLEGPFDSSYSLALLNRETARALANLGQHVVLHSTEGPGDFTPNPEFLAREPDLNRLYQRSLEESAEPARIQSRNLYPPRVADMTAETRLLHHYAWEETVFPRDWVADFNRHLTGITCLSEHVRKVLIDNGVTLPLTVSGCGVDHWDRIEAEPYPITARSFRFLHVSSCFPRKGADALLEAWGRAFSAADDVSLVIKTFDNPHNDIRTQLKRHRNARADYPDVVLIVDDLRDPQLKGLYEQCHALVAPSRAEGFGLPLAEAMLSGLPVITTGWSGQLDFCSADTAWLVDYQLAPADTHFNLSHSLWAEPDVDDLARTLQQVHSATEDELRPRIEAAQMLLREHFGWESIARNLVNQVGTIQNMRAADNLTRPLRIGWVSTWNQKCGLAAYSQHLIDQNSADEVFVFAPDTDETTAPEDPEQVFRCWQLDDRDNLERLKEALLAQQLDVVVIQANIYFYDFDALARLIAALKAQGIVVTITLHATFAPEPRKDLSQLHRALELVDRVMVHTPRDLNRLKQVGIVENAVLLPLGIVDLQAAAVEWPHGDKRCIASYGFALPHKGLEELLEAFARLRRQHHDLVLLLLNAEHPAGSSAATIAHLQRRIHALGLQDSVVAEHRFLPDPESLGMLAQADVIAMPYQHTGESSSAAVKMALASGTPVMVTPLAIFDDVAPAVNFFDGQDVDSVERGLRRALNGELERTAEEVAQWKAAHAFPVVAGRLFAMLRSLWINRPQPGALSASSRKEHLD